jgi:hypothetical protein
MVHENNYMTTACPQSDYSGKVFSGIFFQPFPFSAGFIVRRPPGEVERCQVFLLKDDYPKQKLL